MISKIRAAGVAVAVFACAGASLIGGPVLAWEGRIALPGVSAALGLADPALERDAAPADTGSLDVLVERNAGEDSADAEQECLANAVYFEARGESLQGQLAVAEVVMNRAASGRYPTSLCAVVVQHAQFSFVHRGHMPHADRASEAWHRAVGVARVAAERMAPRLLPSSCLWYHANYVSPSWGRRLAETTRIGLHIFYS
jgi:spore germination cell wall hydrolase CwlJ-like protein